jgi:hypothetical protein
VRWCRRGRSRIQKTDLDRLTRRLTEKIDQVEHRLLAALPQNPPPSRRNLVPPAIAAMITIITAASSWWLFSQAQSGSPTAVDPGRVGVAILGEAGSSTPMQIVGIFHATIESSTSFGVVITDLSGQTAAKRESPPTVVIYVCGGIREGVELRDLNRGALTVQPPGDSPIVMDSRLGDRRSGAYSVDEMTDGFQAIIAGSFTHDLAVKSGAKIQYTLPGVTTLLTEEALQGSTVHPLARDSTVDVALAGPPWT